MVEIGKCLITVWRLSHLFGHMESLAAGRHSLYNAQCPGMGTTVLGVEAGRDLCVQSTRTWLEKKAGRDLNVSLQAILYYIAFHVQTRNTTSFNFAFILQTILLSFLSSVLQAI